MVKIIEEESRMEKKEIKRAGDRAEELGKRILETVRDELYLEMRFLAASFHALTYQKLLSISLAGTDGEKLYFHPGFLIQKYQQDPIAVNRLYLHVIFHCIFQHLWSCENRREEDWNLACDIAAESLIDSLNHPCVVHMMSDVRAECYEWLSKKQKVLTAERIYHILWNGSIEKEKLEQWKEEFLVDDHTFWKNQNQQEFDSNKEQSFKVSGRWKKLGESVKTNLETWMKQAGESAGSLKFYLSVQYRKRKKYSEFLKRFAVWREELHIDEDTFELGFYTFGLSYYGNLPLMEVLEYREEKKIEEFAIVIDTSGSCPEDVIHHFLLETYSILKNRESFFRKTKIHLIQCDAMVQSDCLITSQEELDLAMKQITIHGMGGTDFRPAFRYLDQLKEAGKLSRLKGLLYFTDGYGTFPEQRPPYETAFLFYQKDNFNTAVPAWAISFFLDEEALNLE